MTDYDSHDSHAFYLGILLEIYNVDRLTTVYAECDDYRLLIVDYLCVWRCHEV